MLAQPPEASFRRDPATAVTAWVVAISAAAWLSMILLHDLLHGSSYPEALSALPPEIRAVVRYCGTMPATEGPGLVNWIAGWALMTVAMMLPPALPLLRHFRRLVDGRHDSNWLITTLTASFLAVWVLAGLVLYAAGTTLSLILRYLPVLAERPWLLAGTAAILVGVYQFTPLKMACLDACRSPTSVIMTRWSSVFPIKAAAKIGFAYGAICVGCCWALMLLSVVAGAMALPIMAAAGVFMMLERLLPSVRPLIPLQAGFAIIIGLLLMLGIL
jgi:predicted metal-binding membrane protein